MIRLERLALAATLALAGCPGPTFIVQQYAGPVRPREEIAIVRSNATDEAKLLFLDEEDIAAPIAEDGRLHIEVLPGRHTIVAGRGRDRSRALPFMAERDRVYRVVFEGDEAHVFEVDRAKDTILRDATMMAPTAPPVPLPPAPPTSMPPAPTPVDAGDGTVPAE